VRRGDGTAQCRGWSASGQVTLPPT